MFPRGPCWIRRIIRRCHRSPHTLAAALAGDGLPGASGDRLTPLKMNEENVMISLWRRLVRSVTACLLTGSVALAFQTGQALNDGIYTDQQAMRGQTLYQRRCSSCHGP